MTPGADQFLRETSTRKVSQGEDTLTHGVLWGADTFSLETQLMIVLPQFCDELSSLELNLWVGGQVVAGGLLSDHNIGLDVQIPVDTEDMRDSKPSMSINHRC